MKILYPLLFIFFSFPVQAQYKVSGKVIDQDNKPIELANVTLLQAKDSVILKATLGDLDGNYRFENVKPGNYIISASVIGYQKNGTSFSVENKNLDLPPIQLQFGIKSLNEVVVTATKPFLEQRGDKLIVNVAESGSAVGATALEVLQKVPGVLIRDDKVTLIGKGAPAIYVDGRISQYTDINQVLRDLSAENIDKIELITNPGAKYDATGGAVINILLKKNINLGTNGYVSLATGRGLYNKEARGFDRDFYRLNPSFSLNHRKGKVNTFGSYSYFSRTSFNQTNLLRTIAPNIFIQDNYNPNAVKSHNYRAGLDYYASDKNTFGIILRGFNSANDGEAFNKTTQLKLADNSPVSDFNTNADNNNKRGNFSGNLNWRHTFDTTGRVFNIDLDYSQFSISSNSFITNILSDESSYRNKQFIDNPVKFGVIKADYTLPFNDKSKLEIGLKSSLANIDNFLSFYQREVLDTSRTSDFLYKENINAAYVSYQKSFEKWDVQAGLRTEQTVAKGENKNQAVLDRNYVQYFPSFYLTRKITSKFSTIAQYSKRVNRPSYQQQNPFIQFLDSLTYTKGNPQLKPETADQYKLSLTYQNQPFFSLSYNKTNDVIFENAPQQDGNLTFTSAQNLASFENFAAELNFPLNIGKKISGYGGNQFIYNHYKADYLDGKFDRGKWNWLAYWQVAYKPIKTLSFEASGYYMTNFLNEFLILQSRGSLSLAIRKSFMDNKLRMSLNANDIFLSDVTKGNINYQIIDLQYAQYNETRNVRFGISYSFGNQKLKAARSRNTASEDEAGRVKTN